LVSVGRSIFSIFIKTLPRALNNISQAAALGAQAVSRFEPSTTFLSRFSGIVAIKPTRKAIKII